LVRLIIFGPFCRSKSTGILHELLMHDVNVNERNDVAKTRCHEMRGEAVKLC